MPVKMWFDKCQKAPWQPPGLVFKLVWPSLYVLYIALMILERHDSESTFYLFFGLLLNLCWVPLFTYSSRLALLLLVAMIIVGIKTMAILYKSDKENKRQGFRRRYLLFSPYLTWIVFASTLNAYIAYSCI